uniref:Uncharacterized protein n=1 Tax=Parascaris equorum TaxID=6256 RepID=A0A914S4Z3_PAREQ
MLPSSRMVFNRSCCVCRMCAKNSFSNLVINAGSNLSKCPLTPAYITAT